MSNYKSTLNLPTTPFPMKANLVNREPIQLQQWQQKNIYQRIQQETHGRPRFVCHDGPPYANGNIHVGHAFNKILKDIVIKSKVLAGYQASFVPGWDCHGLPIELIVEKKHGKANHKISAAEFRAKCRSYAQTQVDIQRDSFKRLGIIADWDHPYLTMDPCYEANIIRALQQITKRGHLEQGFKPVYWCLDCHSALAEAEVEYHTKKSSSIDVRFPVVDGADLLQQFGLNDDHTPPVSFVIWTTTPWTLPGNQAVALHPEITYEFMQVTREGRLEIFIMAQSLSATCLTRFNIKDAKTIAVCAGQQLNNVAVRHPFQNRTVPVVMGQHVTTDAGTGCVHTAPGHGPEDYQLAQQTGLPITSPVGENGCYLPDTPDLGGIHVKKADPAVLDLLHKNQHLLHHETIEHSYPHCWRHKTPTIFRATPQWFISLDKANLRDAALTAVSQVRWQPEWGQERITQMIEGRPDWCISRQRAWGVPIPIFIHKESNALHPDTVKLMGKIADRVATEGIEAWFSLETDTFLGKEASQYQKVTDTLDVWFDSGVSHYCVVHDRPELALPAQLYLEGSDQHRGWFQSSMLTSVAMNGKAPYETVITHGFTVDEHGYKMSKSRGNVISPESIIKQYGADILRLWVAASDFRSEPSLSTEILTRISDVYRRIRNTARFLLANLFDVTDPTILPPIDSLLHLDQYIIAKTDRTQKAIIQAYEAHQFHLVYQKIHQFCSQDLGGFYLDIIKDRQYTCHQQSHARLSCQTAIYHVLQALVRWLAPILSFTAEEIWQHIPGQTQDTVFLNTWYTDLQPLKADDPFGQDWTRFETIRHEVNKHLEASRKAGTIGSSLAADLTLYVSPTLRLALEKLQDEARFLFITSRVNLRPMTEKPEDVPESDITGLSIVITASQACKCERCWHRCEDIGSNKAHPTICARCVSNLTLPGETRHYV